MKWNKIKSVSSFVSEFLKSVQHWRKLILSSWKSYIYTFIFISFTGGSSATISTKRVYLCWQIEFITYWNSGQRNSIKLKKISHTVSCTCIINTWIGKFGLIAVPQSLAGCSWVIAGFYLNENFSMSAKYKIIQNYTVF